MKNKNTIKIAVPSNDRMFSDIQKTFLHLKIDITPNGRQLSKKVRWNNQNIVFYYLRSKDIPAVLKAGGADIGFSTDGPILENGIRNLQIVPLNQGKHRFVLAMKENKKLSSQSVLATSYPKMARRFLNSKGFNTAQILSFSGSIEVFPVMGMADGVIEIAQSGLSLSANGLVEQEEIYAAQILLLANKSALKKKKVNAFFESLKSVADKKE